MGRTTDAKLYLRIRNKDGTWTFKRLKEDKYRKIEYCCDYPDLMHIWEPSMGYEPFIYCSKCNKAQYFEGIE